VLSSNYVKETETKVQYRQTDLIGYLRPFQLYGMPNAVYKQFTKMSEIKVRSQ